MYDPVDVVLQLNCQRKTGTGCEQRLTFISLPCTSTFAVPKSFFAQLSILSSPSSPIVFTPRFMSFKLHTRAVSEENRCRTCARPLIRVVTPPDPSRLCDISNRVVLNCRCPRTRRATLSSVKIPESRSDTYHLLPLRSHDRADIQGRCLTGVLRP